MLLLDLPSPVDRSNHPIAVELAVIVAMIAGLSFWPGLARQAVRVFDVDLPLVSSTLLNHAFDVLVTGGIFLGGVVLFTAAYTDYRGMGRGLRLPARTHLPLVVATGATPVAFAGVTKLVADLTGVGYTSLTSIQFNPNTVVPILDVVLAFRVFLNVVTLVVVCHLLIQGSFRQATDDETAIVLTTVVAGFLLETSTSFGGGGVLRYGRLFGAVLFVGLLGWGFYVSSRLSTDRRRGFAYLPLAVFVVGTVLAGIAEIGSVAEGLFGTMHLATFGIAAYSYDRTSSVLPPALAYTGLSFATVGIDFVLESGLQSL